MNKTKIALFCGYLVACSSFFVQAEDVVNTNESAVDTSEASESLETIVVSSQNFSQQIGTQKITAEQIARLPTTNGNITDLLKTNPNVRFSVSADNSNSGGEIKPSEISFHGEKYYNNNFIINGMSNNDNMNPGSDSGRTAARQPAGTNAYDLPGGDTQSFWIDSSLIESVEAFDSNISAKYGNFTGGVVDAKLKDPSFDKFNSGKIYYRRTQDEWAKFHVEDEAAFERATRLDYQPEFTKQQYGVIVNQRLSDKASTRFSYTRTESDIAYYHPALKLRDANGELGTAGSVQNTQKRIAETYMFNGVYLPDNGDLLRTTLIYSPHSARYYKANVYNGGFETTGGGYQANIEWEKDLGDVKMTSYMGYKKTVNNVKHDAQNYNIYRESNNIGWVSNTSGVANEGGYGEFQNEKTIYTLKQQYALKEFDWGSTQHKLNWGWQTDFSQAKYIRYADSINYNYEIPSHLVLSCNGVEACIDGDQYAWKKNVYYARSVKAKDNTYSAYLEDNLKWDKLSASLGVRYDYNQFLGKHNLAPRLSASYDVFGDKATQVFTGFSRYYAGSMLAYKLRQGISQYLIYQRNLLGSGIYGSEVTVGDWLTPGYAYHNTYDVSKLENPYSDEITLGVGQKLWGADFTLKWVHRNSRKELVTQYVVNSASNTTYATLTNAGWSKTNNFTLSIKPMQSHQFKYATIDWDFGYSYKKTKTNNKWYQSSDVTTDDYIIYNDKLYYAVGGATPTDFNNPYEIFFNLNTTFPQWRLTWAQRFSYVGGRDYIYNEGSVTCNGSSTTANYKDACGSYVGTASLYKDAHQASHFALDWRLAYKQPTFKDQYVELTLDVNNVLNKRAIAKSAGGNTIYKMGRNFWFGVSYNW